MLLVDCLYINYGGGKVLLEYLIQHLEQNYLGNVYYIFDKRCQGEFDFIPNDRRVYLKASIISRIKFYLFKGRMFSKIFCFGNIPPPIKVKAKVFTYFHQRMFLEIPGEMSIKTKIALYLKISYFKYLLSHSDSWIVQTGLMKKGLNHSFRISLDQINVFPFYPNEDLINNNYTRDLSYVYVSDVSPHKNHELLIESFCAFYDKSKVGILKLTVADQYVNIIDLINTKVKMGYPIINYGFVNRGTIVKMYNESKFLIYPSSSESFGLGIIESIECGCAVIGANLEYMYEVCSPSLSFDLTLESLVHTFEKSLIKFKKTEQKLFNEINTMVKFLYNA